MRKSSLSVTVAEADRLFHVVRKGTKRRRRRHLVPPEREEIGNEKAAL